MLFHVLDGSLCSGVILLGQPLLGKFTVLTATLVQAGLGSSFNYLKRAFFIHSLTIFAVIDDLLGF